MRNYEEENRSGKRGRGCPGRAWRGPQGAAGLGRACSDPGERTGDLLGGSLYQFKSPQSEQLNTANIYHLTQFLGSIIREMLLGQGLSPVMLSSG